MLRFLLLLPLLIFANTQTYRASIEHIEGGGIGYKNGYTTLALFFASDPDRWMVTPFLDVRGHVFDDGGWATNLGSGIRTLWNNRVYGINAFYDYRDSSRLNSNQIGLGVETLGKLVDFRMNGYLPVGTKISDPYNPVFANFAGNYMFIWRNYQAAMKGANAEIGLHLGRSKLFDVYAALGPYYFIGDAIAPTWGGKARLSLTYKNFLSLEISDSYDKTFQNKFQGQLSLKFSFGPKSKEKISSKMANSRIMDSVDRQEIIVMDTTRKKTIAIDPLTAQPYLFVFVENTGNSNGTYESPFHSLAQVEANSSLGNIIYVFPGDGTTRGMDSGILLKEMQKLWGSANSHLIQTSQGLISIPAQSSAMPIMTNTNIDTEGNIITLSRNNAISGLILSSAINDAIYGTNVQSLEVSSCTIKNTSTFPIEATSSGSSLVLLTDNQFLNNVNGVSLTLNGTSTFVCSKNNFENQTSVSNVPIEISSNNNNLASVIKNNTFKNNETGSVRINLTDVSNADISLFGNTITNNQTGAQSTLGSSITILSTGVINNCSIALSENSFSNNTLHSLYLHTSGQFRSLNVACLNNTMSSNGGGALVLATPVNNLDLFVQNNTISSCNDNGIAVIASGTTSTGNIIIKNNTITNLGNYSNGMAINQDFSNLDLTISNNYINQCNGTGILSYASTGINSLTLNVSGNTVANCENASRNAASAIDIEQFINLTGSVDNNTLSNNNTTDAALVIGSTLTAPRACLNFTGNSSTTDYSFTNPGDGVFNLTPCNVNSVNSGVINTSGTINSVCSCSSLTSCSP
jgi:hypothetical protein